MDLIYLIHSSKAKTIKELLDCPNRFVCFEIDAFFSSPVQYCVILVTLYGELYQLKKRWTLAKQGYALKNWVERLSDEVYHI